MSSQKSGTTVASELARQVLAQLQVAPGTERTLAQLYEFIDAEDLKQLHAVVWALVRRGRIVAKLRVRSPFGDHPNLGYYDTFDQIPDPLEDDWLDEPVSFPLKRADVVVVFRASQPEARR